MTNEDVDGVLKDILGTCAFVSQTDRLMAAIVFELRELRKQSKPANVFTKVDNHVIGPTVAPDLDFHPGDEAIRRCSLAYHPARKILVIKAIRTALGLGLREAKDLSEAPAFSLTRWQERALAVAFNKDLPGEVTLYPVG